MHALGLTAMRGWHGLKVLAQRFRWVVPVALLLLGYRVPVAVLLVLFLAVPSTEKCRGGHRCGVCGERFASRNQLFKHLGSQHPTLHVTSGRVSAEPRPRPFDVPTGDPLQMPWTPGTPEFPRTLLEAFNRHLKGKEGSSLRVPCKVLLKEADVESRPFCNQKIGSGDTNWRRFCDSGLGYSFQLKQTDHGALHTDRINVMLPEVEKG